ncbi:MAG: ribonuclease Z [Rikenellaceae bacterium]
MLKFEFTVLGSLAAMPDTERHQSSHILNMNEQYYLIDCGEGVQRQMRRYRFSLQKINQIFVTHLHGDHFYGLFGVISTLSLLGRKAPLKIYAPAPLQRAVENHINIFEPNLGYTVECIEVDCSESQKVMENKVMEVWSVPLLHKIPTVGYLFKEKTPRRNIKPEYIEHYNLDHLEINRLKDGKDVVLDSGELVSFEKVTRIPYTPRMFAYLSDTSPSKAAAELIKGANLLYHESTFLEKDKPIAMATGHSTTKDAAYIATMAKVKQLILGHFSLRYKGGIEPFKKEGQKYFPNCLIAKEGQSYKVY